MDQIEISAFAGGEWQRPGHDRRPIISPVDGQPVAMLSGARQDFARMAEFARQTGGPALRRLTFHDRARMLRELAGILNDRKSALYALNPLTGATRRDGWYDIDGGIGTLFTYASKGRRELPDDQVYLDGGVEALSPDGSFLGRHIAAPLQGVSVQINAFNFPVWGMLEKLAPAILAGVPVIVKPATVTAYLAQECFRLIVESGILPAGAVQFAPGRAEGLLSCLATQDIVGFTGSAATAGLLRNHPAIASGQVRFIAEQDSLNATVLGPDIGDSGPGFDTFVDEAVREITTKAGQKCTAIRRILAPSGLVDAVIGALAARLAAVRVGNPALAETGMGPLASRQHREAVDQSIAQIAREAEPVAGAGPAGDFGESGAYMTPRLFRCRHPGGAELVHSVEAFGPVATVMPYDSIGQAAALANRGGGSLVVSVFTADLPAARQFVIEASAWHGRIYFNSETTRAAATGHGSPMPHLLHGGPGRAGGGEELGGIRSVMNYMQRTAIQGSATMLAAVGGRWIPGAPERPADRHPFRKSFEELQLGETMWSDTRTISLGDIEHFAEFTGDRFYAHMDEAAASRNPFFPGRVAHGYLLLSFAAGLFVDPDEGPVLANTGLNSLAFLKPVVAGDSIRVRLTVGQKFRRRPEYGEVRWDVAIFNQDAEEVARYELLTLNAVSTAD